MTGFDKLFIVKMNKMIHKKTGASFLVVYVMGGLYLFHYVLDNLNWLVFVFLSNLIINLMYNIIKKEFKNDFDKIR